MFELPEVHKQILSMIMYVVTMPNTIKKNNFTCKLMNLKNAFKNLNMLKPPI